LFFRLEFGAVAALRRSELARERCWLVRKSALSLTLGCAPRPEGRGDCSECLDALESAGGSVGFRVKPYLLSARPGPLSLQGEGGGRGALFPSTKARQEINPAPANAHEYAD